MDMKYFQIDEVAKITGLTKRTIRYYEDMEIIKPIRTDASYRLYTEDEVETIKEIKDLRSKLGLNLSQVKQMLGLKKKVNDILDGSSDDEDYIKESIVKINELLRIIDEKEEVLRKVKNNCNNYLTRLNKIVTQQEDEEK